MKIHRRITILLLVIQNYDHRQTILPLIES